MALTHTPTQTQQGPILRRMLNYYFSFATLVYLSAKCFVEEVTPGVHQQLRRRDFFISYWSTIHRAVGNLSPNVSCYNVMFLPSAPTRTHFTAGVDVSKVDLGCAIAFGNRKIIFITLGIKFNSMILGHNLFTIYFCHYYVYSTLHFLFYVNASGLHFYNYTCNEIWNHYYLTPIH